MNRLQGMSAGAAERETLLDYIPRIEPRYEAPRHLAPMLELLEHANERPFRAVVSTPPRHTKTESILFALPFLMRQDPYRTHAYATYGADLSRSKSLKAQRYAERSGLRVKGPVHEWRTPEGGGLLATSILGRLTGMGVDGVAVVDDPVKDRLVANSKLMRDRHHDWFRDVLYTRVEPGGSVLVVMTRWHPDDLAGRLIDEGGWIHINLEAICTREDDPNGRAIGDALWPSRWPVQALEEKRRIVGEYTWASLYQGAPRPLGDRLFNDIHYYDALPTSGYRVAIGVDLAYSEKTSADYSVAVVMLEKDGFFFVRHVVRRQEKSPVFIETLRRLTLQWPAAPVLWYAAGTEKGAADFFIERGIRLDVEQPPGDKFTRAQPTAALWSEGKILLPPGAGVDGETDWFLDFVDEVNDFTGIKDRNDDQVDALVAACDVLRRDDASVLDDLLKVSIGPGIRRTETGPDR